MIKGKKYWLNVGTLLGILICGWLGISAVDGKILERTKEQAISAGNLIFPKFGDNPKDRRDPFKPLIKPLPSSGSAIFAKPKTAVKPKVSRVKDPNWKLLGVIHGQSGRQAVIQISPKKRKVVGLGAEVIHLGWTVKEIGEGEVLLEHSSTGDSVKGSPTPRTFTLSFSPSRKS